MAREMKDSGVPWIGHIPAEWELVRTKHCYTNHKDIAGDSADDYERLALTLNGVIKRPKDDATGLQPEAFNGYQILRENELVFKLIDLANVATSRVGYSPYTGIVSPAYIILHPLIETESKYGEYYFLSMWQREVFNHMGDDGVRSSLNASDLLNVPYISAPADEKKRIVNYLDAECCRIDAVIEQTRASIEEYKKLKQAVITQAVTKGIRPGREMKDSGVEWIGDIASDWQVIKLKAIICAIESGTSVNAAQYPAGENQTGVLKTSCVSKFAFIPSENKAVNEDEISRVSCPVKANTIIMSRMNTPELVGACGFIECDYPNLYLPDRLWRVSFANGTNVKFFWYFLNSSQVRSYYSSLAVGTSSSMQNISQDQFYHTYATLPNKEEQDEIVSYLDTRIEAFDKLIHDKETLLSELESYKKSLIYEYVTGKKEVPA